MEAAIGSSDSSVALTREELYELVWTTPMLTLAKRFGLSDVGLAKICDKYQIPRPERGHWAKKSHGKRVVKRKLPESTDSKQLTILLAQVSGETESEKKDPPYFVHELQVLADREGDSHYAMTVRDTLHSLHPEVAKIRDHLKDAKTDSEGFVKTNRESALRVQVGKATINRTLRILDAFVKGLERRGFEIRKSACSYRQEMCLVWRGHEMEFRMREKLERHQHVLTEQERKDKTKYHFSWAPNWDFSLTGRLEIEVQGLLIHDGKKVRLEEMLHKLVLKMYRRIDYWEKSKSEMAQREEQQKALERERLDRERKAKEESDRRDQLWAEVGSWQQAELIRAYVREVIQGDGIDKSDPWTIWALRQADALDPLLRRRATCNADAD